MNCAFIILAAGKGTRMESDLAKVLHPLSGKPLIAWVLSATQPLQPARTVVVVGHQAEAVEAAVRERFEGIEFVLQPKMLGTGHAVRQADPLLRDFAGDIIVLCGDTPLIRSATLEQLVQRRREGDAVASMLVAKAADPGSYGRVLCGQNGEVLEIVEAKDAAPDVLAVRDVNAGMYCFNGPQLWRHLANVSNHNKSGEFYLTDVIGLMTQAGQRVNALFVSEQEMIGINTRAQLQGLEMQLSEGQGQGVE